MEGHFRRRTPVLVSTGARMCWLRHRACSNSHLRTAELALESMSAGAASQPLVVHSVPAVSKLLLLSMQTRVVSEQYLVAMMLVKHSSETGVMHVQGLMHHLSVPAQCNPITLG